MSYLVVESGVHRLSNGAVIQAGKTTMEATLGLVQFEQPFRGGQLYWLLAKLMRILRL